MMNHFDIYIWFRVIPLVIIPAIILFLVLKARKTPLFFCYLWFLVSILIWYCILTSLTFFISCSSNDKEKEDENSFETNNLSQATLEFWFVQDYTGNGEKPGTRSVLNETEKRVMDRLNVKLNFKWFNPIDYNTQIETYNSSGEKMDAFFVPGLQSFDFVKMVRNGEVKDITKLLPANAPRKGIWILVRTWIHFQRYWKQ